MVIFSSIYLYERSCLNYVICVFFAYSGVQHILCCAFVLFFLVLCTLCCQLLWIFHFCLTVRYSQTFILSKLKHFEYHKLMPANWILNLHVCVLLDEIKSADIHAHIYIVHWQKASSLVPWSLGNTCLFTGRLPLQSVHITTKVVSSKPAQAMCTRYNVMCIFKLFVCMSTSDVFVSIITLNVVNRRWTDNTMTKRKGQEDKQNTLQKYTDLATRTALKTGVNSGALDG